MTFSREAKSLCMRTVKSRYLSYDFARREMEEVIRTQEHANGLGRRMFVYRCRLCQGFHFGSTFETAADRQGSRRIYRERRRRLHAAFATDEA